MIEIKILVEEALNKIYGKDYTKKEVSYPNLIITETIEDDKPVDIQLKKFVKMLSKMRPSKISFEGVSIDDNGLIAIRVIVSVEEHCLSTGTEYKPLNYIH